MASDQKCVTGLGAPNASKYDTSRRMYHQFVTQHSAAHMSSRSLVSKLWSKMVHSAATQIMTNVMAGNRRFTRRSQNCGRLMVPVLSHSISRRLVIR